MYHKVVWLILVISALFAGGALAQDGGSLPKAHQISGFRYEAQGWNNCGPATLTNALTYFGYQDNQNRAAAWLKPAYDDKNVSPWQMVDFVNTQVPELAVYATTRAGGTQELLKKLLYNNFPVIIEAGYDPEPDRLGWMGHYLLVTGYDDSVGVFITQDSYLGPNHNYTYEHVDRFWKHFNRTYIVLYESAREQQLLDLLGSDADPKQNAINALEAARAEAVANPNDPFAWFNMGTNFVALGMYPEAAVAYDQARNVGGGLPWRMTWYQFGIYEAYLQAGRPDDVIAIARTTIDNGRSQGNELFYVEETYYYAGLAREAKGEVANALNNYNTALQLNANFTPAREARDRLQTASS